MNFTVLYRALITNKWPCLDLAIYAGRPLIYVLLAATDPVRYSTQSAHGRSHSYWHLICVWFQVVKCSFFVSPSPSFAQYRRYGTQNLTWGWDRITCGAALTRRCPRPVCRPSSLTCRQTTLSASPAGLERSPRGNSHRRLPAHPRQAPKNGTLVRTEDRAGSR